MAEMRKRSLLHFRISHPPVRGKPHVLVANRNGCIFLFIFLAIAKGQDFENVSWSTASSSQ